MEYLMASLPTLAFGRSDSVKDPVVQLLRQYGDQSRATVSLIKILDQEAAKFLPDDQFNVFQKINWKTIHSHSVQKYKSTTLRSISEFSRELSRQLRDWRLLGKDDPGNNHPLFHMIGSGTPLDQEINIMQYQWSKLEDVSSGHFADFDALVIYKLKLSLLLRLWSFDAKKGYDQFIQLTTS